MMDANLKRQLKAHRYFAAQKIGWARVRLQEAKQAVRDRERELRELIARLSLARDRWTVGYPTKGDSWKHRDLCREREEEEADAINYEFAQWMRTREEHEE